MNVLLFVASSLLWVVGATSARSTNLLFVQSTGILKQHLDVAFYLYPNIPWERKISSYQRDKSRPFWRSFIKFHVIKGNEILPDGKLDEYDVIIPYSYAELDRWSKIQPKIPRALLNGIDVGVIDTLRNKGKWKEWMRRSGLGEHMPAAYTESNAKYPCIFKLVDGESAQNGKGVIVIQNKSQLSHTIASAEKMKAEYLIEEAIPNSPFELTAYGSAVNGILTSMRCVVTKFDPEGAPDVKQGLFVAGAQHRYFLKYYSPCGQDIVAVNSAMVQKSNYTGIFCSDWKVSGDGKQSKVLEVNPRLCGKALLDTNLLTSMAVPLGNALQKASGKSVFVHQRRFPKIVEIEKKLVLTGGAPSNETSRRLSSFKSVGKFNELAQYSFFGYENLQ